MLTIIFIGENGGKWGKMGKNVGKCVAIFKQQKFP
jgi:hypothetical protein